MKRYNHSNQFITHRAHQLIKLFEALAPLTPKYRKDGKGTVKGWRMLAANECNLFKIEFPDNKPEIEKRYYTAWKHISTLKNELYALTRVIDTSEDGSEPGLRDPLLVNSVRTVIRHFIDELTSYFLPYKMRANIDYKKDVEKRSSKENRVEINLTDYISKAYEVLQDPSNYKWMDLSIALALVTGRRMSEIHATASFKVIDEYTVLFKGQLKGKDRKVDGKKLINTEFVIPTLVPAELVVNGLDYLENENKKRISSTDDIGKVNRNYSRYLSERMKSEWAFIGEDTTYHKCRAAYLRASIINQDVDPFDYINYARSIMGDDDKATIETYQRYHIKKGTLTICPSSTM